VTALRGLVFDLDGTLVDTTYVHTVCWWQALERHGHRSSMARIHRAVGLPGPELLDAVLGSARSHIDDGEVMATEGALFRCWDGPVTPTPGARLLLRWCQDEGLRVAVASSSKPEDAAPLLAAVGPFDFDAVVTAEDVEEGKPQPEPVVVALDRAGLAPEEAIVVGDAVWDMESGRRAGVVPLGLECGGTSAAELLAGGAEAVFADPHQLHCALHSVVHRPDWRSELRSLATAAERTAAGRAHGAATPVLQGHGSGRNRVVRDPHPSSGGAL
jgi:beta-phosphoglucomutase-like phosphatase (HAD superfamily)